MTPKPWLRFATDGKLLPPTSVFVQGRESNEAYRAPFIEGVQGKLDIQEAHEAGGFAYLLGTFQIVNTKGKVVDRGKYVEIWNRTNG